MLLTELLSNTVVSGFELLEIVDRIAAVFVLPVDLNNPALENDPFTAFAGSVISWLAAKVTAELVVAPNVAFDCPSGAPSCDE